MAGCSITSAEGPGRDADLVTLSRVDRGSPAVPIGWNARVPPRDPRHPVGRLPAMRYTRYQLHLHTVIATSLFSTLDRCPSTPCLRLPPCPGSTPARGTAPSTSSCPRKEQPASGRGRGRGCLAARSRSTPSARATSRQFQQGCLSELRPTAKLGDETVESDVSSMVPES